MGDGGEVGGHQEVVSGVVEPLFQIGVLVTLSLGCATVCHPEKLQDL